MHTLFSMNSRLIVALLLGLGFFCQFATLSLAADQNGSSKTVVVGTKKISLTLPLGYCFVDGARPVDVHFTNTTRGMFAGLNLHLLDILVDCGELAKWRERKIPDLDNLGQYITPVAMLGKDLPITRAQFSSSICAKMRRQAKQKMVKTMTDAMKKAEKFFEGVKASGQKFLGVLHEDIDACYAGMLSTLKTQAGALKKVVGVFSMTLVKGKMVQLNLYTRYKGEASINRLLDIQKKNIKALLAKP